MSIWSPLAQILKCVSTFPANIRLMELGSQQNNELPEEGKSGSKSLFSWDFVTLYFIFRKNKQGLEFYNFSDIKNMNSKNM